MKKNYVLSVLLLFVTQLLGQSNATLSSVMPSTIEVCQAPVLYNVKLVNDGASSLGTSGNLVTDQITVNSQQSGDYNYYPSASVVDVLTINNTGNGQVDIKIHSAVLIRQIVFNSPNSGSSKLRAGGNFPYPTIQYCSVVDPGNVSVFENSVTQTSGANCNSPSGGLTYTIALPTGISYVAGSLSETSNYSVAEDNIQNTSNFTLTSSALPAGDSIEFSILINASTAARIAHQQGLIFRNEVTVDIGASNLNHFSTPYNLFYPALSILSVTPNSQNAIPGDLVTRSVQMINAGNGKLASFELIDSTNLSGLTLVGASLGTVQGNKIVFSASDFQTVGNGDGFFNTNEFITVVETLSVSGCTEHVVTSDLNTSWGCNGDAIASVSSFSHVSISTANPNLSLSANSSLSSCFSSTSSEQQITLTNKGSGYAQNVTVDVFKSTGSGYNQDLFSALEENSFTYQIGNNGTPISISGTSFATRNDGAYACLGANPIGRVLLTLPINIAPGQRVIIKWNSNHCCISECNEEKLMGWQYKVDYEDMCGNNTYTSTKTGEGKTSLEMNLFTETPINIRPGETLPFVYTISSHDNNLPVGTGAAYIVEVILPNGLDYAGGVNGITWGSSPQVWYPDSVAFSTGNRTLTAVFDLPPMFLIQKSEIDVRLTGNCTGVSSGDKTIKLNIKYLPDATCNSCMVDMVCNQITSTRLQCPDPNCEGINMVDFAIQRTSFGLPDNNTDGIADQTGSLDFDRIKTNRVMVGDTLSMTYKGYINTGSNNAHFINYFVEADIDYGQNLTFVDGEITIYDDVTNSHYVTSAFQSTSVNGAGNSKKFRYTFLPNYSGANLPVTPGTANQFYFTDGDSVQFVVNYVVTGNIGGDVKEVTVNNDVFTSGFSDPWGANAGALHTDKWSCNDYDGRFTLIGYYFDNKGPNRVTIRKCSKVVRQDFLFSIGDCCDNFEGGNLFPYEYRNWATIKECRVSIPTDYAVESVTFSQRRTRTTNQHATQTVSNLVPFHNSGGNMHFDLSQHYADNGGTILKSDDGFSGTVSIVLSSSCDVSVGVYENVEWQFEFDKSSKLGGGTTGFLTSPVDKVRYYPTTLSMSSSNPTQDGLGRTVTWNLKLKSGNANSAAANCWVHFKSASQDMEVQYVIDDDTGDTLALSNDIYKLGTIETGSSKNLRVTATYSGCAPDQLVSYSGYECSGYPIDFAHFYCPYSTMALRVEPKNAEPQVKISGTTVGGDCSDIVEITVEVASVRFAHLDSVKIKVTPVGEGMTLISGTDELLYPLNQSYQSISSPVQSQGAWVYNVMELNDDLRENGLEGVLDISRNRFRLKFKMELDDDFEPGDHALITIESKEICGTSLPVFNLAYDPSIQFNQNLISGLTNDASNTWGVAWGDFNGDGFDDAFIAEYDQDRPSVLYQNNGNGTFTPVTSGPIANSLGSSIAGTWGDYNNDGNLDLFVANNVGAENALFKNIGNGQFSEVTTGDIANYGGYCHGASWVDYNNDGYLDLFVTDYMPTKFNVLYKNNGDETFTSITNTELVQEATRSIGATWADYDNDGDMDVFVPATEGNSNSLFQNNGAGKFTKMTQVGIPIDNANSVGCSWGDADNDGDLDLFVANTSNQNNFFYLNNGDGTFTQVTSGALVSDGGHSSSSNWIDFDNDGDLDIYVCNDQQDANVLYLNDGNANFTKPETPLAENIGNSYSQGWSDFDNDGDLDVLIGNHSDEYNAFFVNGRASCNSWVCFKLTGVNSNYNAIGARIRVKATINGVPTWQMKEISAQTGGGAGSQNSLKTIFGLADATAVDSVIIHWPSGYRQVLTNPAMNTCNDITEGSGMQVCGVIYHDANNNCVQDEGELGIPGVQLTIQPGDRIVTTHELGEYQFFIEEGDYSVTPVITSNWVANCLPSTISLSVESGNVYCGNNFGLTALCTQSNLYVSTGVAALRKGFRNDMVVNYGNNGVEDAINAQIQLTLDENIVPISATIPWDNVTQVNNEVTYTWNLDTISALSAHSLVIVDSISVNSTVGDLLTTEARISYSQTDCDTSDNVYAEVNEVVGPVDPNDILVYPKGDGVEGYIAATQRMSYKIRFQNVGTYMAQNITLINKVPQGLDLNTIDNFISSHEYSMEVNGNEMRITFKDICLPDSATSLEQSNGFFSYTIYPQRDLPGGFEITNNADIIFDYEDPLRTNTVLNTIKYSDYSVENQVRIHPNPVMDFTNVYLELTQNRYISNQRIMRVEFFDMLGNSIMAKDYSEETQKLLLDLSHFLPGCYLIRVYNDEGQPFEQKFIKQ